MCIELPAGLSDQGETPEECALRELKEGTGYVGTIDSDENCGVAPVSTVMFNGTSKSPCPMRQKCNNWYHKIEESCSSVGLS